MEEKIYLSDPCGVSSLPFWKTETVTIPRSLKIVRDDEYLQQEYAAYIDVNGAKNAEKICRQDRSGIGGL